MDDEIKEEDKIEFFSDPKIGYTLDWQNTKRLGVVQYGYLNLSQEEKEDMDEENAKEEEKKERDWRLGLHLHKSF